MMSPIQRLLAIGVVASAVIAAPTPAEVDGSACEPLPHGRGLIPRPDTAEAFRSFDPFSKAATSASTPIGYVQAYSNLLTTFDEPSQFVRYKNLDSYDVQKCAAECNNEARCNAFAIFFERSPLLKPGKGCENPSSSTLIKCTMWSGTILPDLAVNKGQMRADFRVVLAGSNAYVKDIAFGGDKNITPVVPKGWATQRYSNGAAILAPLDCHGVDTYMGMSYWRDGQLNAQRCIDACEVAGKTDLQNRKCNFVNTYMLRKNGVPVSQHCAMFSQYWPALFATNTGQLRGLVTVDISTDSYGIRRSNVEYTACYNQPTTQRPASPTISILPIVVPSSLIPSLSTIAPLPTIPSLPNIAPFSLITALPMPILSQIPSLRTPLLPSLIPRLPTTLPSSRTTPLPTTLSSSRITSLPTPTPSKTPAQPIHLHIPPFILPRATTTAAFTSKKTLAVPSSTSLPITATATATATANPTSTPTTSYTRKGNFFVIFETAPSAYTTATIVDGIHSNSASATTMTVDPYLTPGEYTFLTSQTIHMA